MSLDATQTKYAKYASIKTANFTATQLNHGCQDDTEIYLAHNEEKSVLAEIFIAA